MILYQYELLCIMMIIIHRISTWNKMGKSFVMMLKKICHLKFMKEFVEKTFLWIDVQF